MLGFPCNQFLGVRAAVTLRVIPGHRLRVPSALSLTAGPVDPIPALTPPNAAQQEPGDDETIKAFVKEKYGVTFPVRPFACALTAFRPAAELSRRKHCIPCHAGLAANRLPFARRC